MINFFKPITFKWWQAGIFKTTMFSFGIAVGAYWSSFFTPWITVLLVVFVVGWLYLVYFYIKNLK